MSHAPLSYANELTDLRTANHALELARETIISLMPREYQNVLKGIGSDGDYFGAIERTIMELGLKKVSGPAWEPQRYACPLCDTKLTPAGVARHVGVDPKGHQKLCRVVEAGWAKQVHRQERQQKIA